MLSKAKIGSTIYDIVTYDEYTKNIESYDPDYTAIKLNDGYLYPIRKNGDYRPGMYDAGVMNFFIAPSGRDAGIYSQQCIIDFDKASTFREIIQCQQKLANEERSILTTIDNEYTPEIGENDAPEMKALKQSISDKHIDLDKYEHRFGPNYNNDKRLLKKDSITFGKLRAVCNALDIKATLTLQDAAPDVPNPMNRVINVDITGPGMSISGDESEEK